MLRPRIGSATDWSRETAGLEHDVAGFVTGAMIDTTAEVKEAFRDQVRAAGLGERLPNAVRGIAYPNRMGRVSLNPAGWVYAQPSKSGRGAAAIIDAYANGRMIVATNGRRRLAIPSDDCPRNRNGAALTPKEVEARFGRRLVEIPATDKGFGRATPSRLTAGQAYLVMRGVVTRKKTGLWRPATPKELAGRTRNPRPVQQVIMFTLVRQVKKPASINLSAPAAIAEARFEANLNTRWR